MFPYILFTLIEQDAEEQFECEQVQNNEFQYY